MRVDWKNPGTQRGCLESIRVHAPRNRRPPGAGTSGGGISPAVNGGPGRDVREFGTCAETDGGRRREDTGGIRKPAAPRTRNERAGIAACMGNTRNLPALEGCAVHGDEALMLN